MKKLIVMLMMLAGAAGATQLDLTGADVRVQTATNAANPVRLDQLQSDWGGQDTPSAVTGMVVNVNGSLTYLTNVVSAYRRYWTLSVAGDLEWTDFVPSPTPGTFTNKQTFVYTGGDQTFVVPAGITNILVKGWGAGCRDTVAITAGYTHEGGYSAYIHSVTPGDTLTIKVGGVGAQTGTLNTYAAGGWPDGGQGWCSNASYIITGGSGSSQVFNGTNLIQVAGGSGGHGRANGGGGGDPGAGGGWTGGGGYGSYAGSGASQTAGGTSGGGYLQGGNASPIAAVSRGGGGGGYYGGGAGYATSLSIGGGGGSGYVPSIYGPGAVNIRDNADYDTDWAASYGAQNNNGAVVVRY